ncbi:MAG: hypothetical protein OQJ89_14970 [Kangiellaceae bacterium]|nr:hypothetical protein [Kangiellaceae bacterium]MCW9018271.1 hypothetical protein [Kangiellaceae bacterium]
MKQKNRFKRIELPLIFALLAGSHLASANDSVNTSPVGTNSKSGSLAQTATQAISANSTSLNGNSLKFTQPVESSFLQDLVNRSDLIFKGELIEKSEGLSMEGIPYTFVTYKLDQIIAGKYPDQTITLKYVGGTFANGNRLSATNTPEVSVGEQSILMVQKSNDTGCDFVDCEHGRFVLQGGKIIAANQSAIVVDAKGGVDFISYSAQLKGTHKASIEKSNIPQFISHLQALDQSSNALRKTARISVGNIDKHAPFAGYAALTRAMAAPKPPKAKTQTRNLNANQHDQWELEQLRKNGGNPVLSESFPGEK